MSAVRLISTVFYCLLLTGRECVTHLLCALRRAHRHILHGLHLTGRHKGPLRPEHGAILLHGHIVDLFCVGWFGLGLSTTRTMRGRSKLFDQIWISSLRFSQQRQVLFFRVIKEFSFVYFPNPAKQGLLSGLTSSFGRFFSCNLGEREEVCVVSTKDGTGARTFSVGNMVFFFTETKTINPGF